MKKLLSLLILPLFIFSCDITPVVDFSGHNFCSDGYTAISRGCESDSPADRIEISVEEFSRLKSLLENSTEDCVNVTINPLDESESIESTLRNYPQPILEICEVGW